GRARCPSSMSRPVLMRSWAFELAPPFGHLLRSPPGFVEPDDPPAGLGDTGPFLRWDLIFEGLERLERRNQQRLGLGVILLPQERAAELRPRAVRLPIAGPLFLADGEGLAQHSFRVGPLLLFEEVRPERAQRAGVRQRVSPDFLFHYLQQLPPPGLRLGELLPHFQRADPTDDHPCRSLHYESTRFDAGGRGPKLHQGVV